MTLRKPHVSLAKKRLEREALLARNSRNNAVPSIAQKLHHLLHIASGVSNGDMRRGNMPVDDFRHVKRGDNSHEM